MRRNDEGEFTESDDLNRSLSRDNDQNAEHTSQPGDEGDGHTGSRNPPKK
ncbi:hypothetical protein [Hymenobacter sp. BT190]|nr:hypothetical protein [Hymenobacter sp. BT190]